jgi:hypothetical protein
VVSSLLVSVSKLASHSLTPVSHQSYAPSQLSVSVSEIRDILI